MAGGRAGLGAGWIMDVFPFLALPLRALTGARSTAWCLHPVLSKNARKSSGESVREGFKASAAISHTMEYQEFCSGSSHAGSDLIPFVEVTKLKRYFDIFLMWDFFIKDHLTMILFKEAASRHTQLLHCFQ